MVAAALNAWWWMRIIQYMIQEKIAMLLFIPLPII